MTRNWSKRRMVMSNDLSEHENLLFRPEELPEEFYFKNYADLTRFISYFYQIDSVFKLKPRTILEVGVGNNLVSNYLKQSGFKVTTVDINKNLKPDVVGNLANLPFLDNTFDVVLAFEILEHIPFRDVPTSLYELRRVSRRKVIISLPYSCLFVESIFSVKTPFMTRQLRLFLGIPTFRANFKRRSGHYWEMGYKNYPKKEVRKLLERYFKITSEFQPLLNPYHYFFILEKTSG